MPRLPAIIYGVISISCGIISLYVPETLNRPLPNSIDDIVKWPRSLSKEEKKVVHKLNREERNAVIKSIFSCCLKKKLKRIPCVGSKKQRQHSKTAVMHLLSTPSSQAPSVCITNELANDSTLPMSNFTLLSNINNINTIKIINSNTLLNKCESTTLPSLSSSSSSNSMSNSSSNLSV